MKTQQDPRHQRRIIIMQTLYGLQFQPTVSPDIPPDIAALTDNVVKNRDKINAAIDMYAKSFTSARMSKIDLAILQLGVYELLFDKKEPYRVVLDEAIELAKEFGSNNSQKFINGILGHIVEKDFRKT